MRLTYGYDMLIDVRDILKASGLSKTVELETTAESCGIKATETECEFNETFYVLVELTNIKGMIRAKGEVRTGYVTFCARCLKPVHATVRSEFDDEYVRYGVPGSISFEETDVYEYSDKEINIGYAIRDAVLLDLPIRRLCSEDCMSICPLCGKDLNDGPCRCEQPVGDIRFEALKTLLDNNGGEK